MTAMNTTRYDTAFYVQALDRFVATGECAETDTEPLYAYLLSVMNDSMVKVQVLGDEVCARIFYDTMMRGIPFLMEFFSPRTFCLAFRSSTSRATLRARRRAFCFSSSCWVRAFCCRAFCSL